MRRSNLGFLCMFVAVSQAACTVSVETDTRFTSKPTSKSGTKDYVLGDKIHIDNRNGNLTLIADANVTKISATVTAFSFAPDDERTNAEKALEGVLSTLTIDENTSGEIKVKCGQSPSNFGNAQIGKSGCDITVTVPAPSSGIRLKAQAGNGTLETKGTFVAAPGPDLNLVIATENGSVVVGEAVGSVQLVTAGAGDITAYLRPTQGSSIVVRAGFDADISLPSDFAADALFLAPENKRADALKIVGFPDVTAASTARGPAGAGASKIDIATGSVGTLTLSAR